MKLVILTKSKEETMKLGEKLAQGLFLKAVITLSGDLGAGKTTLVAGVAKGLKIEEIVTSPTFNILKCYFHKPLSLFHIDAYRLDGVNKDIGLEEFIDGDGVTMIEWPNYIEEMIPLDFLEVIIRNFGNDKRELTFISHGVKHDQLLSFLGENKI